MRDSRAAGLGQPVSVIGLKPAGMIGTQLCGSHQGQRSLVPHTKAAHMTCTRPLAAPNKTLAPRAPSTHDANCERMGLLRYRSSCYGGSGSARATEALHP